MGEEERSRLKTPGEASDMEVAMHWAKELEHPCCDPENPEVNLGYKWL